VLFRASNLNLTPLDCYCGGDVLATGSLPHDLGCFGLEVLATGAFSRFEDHFGRITTRYYQFHN
jgi:hypothetical protein